MTQILLVGGPSDIKRDLDQHLRQLGCEVVDHWPYREKEHKRRQIRRSVDAVLLLTDMIGHNLQNNARDEAKALSIPVIFGTRKWATCGPRVQQALGIAA